jgi:hypothetical protein
MVATLDLVIRISADDVAGARQKLDQDGDGIGFGVGAYCLVPK